MVDTPPRVPWISDVKSKGELTLAVADSANKAGWSKVFKDAVFEFNRLSSSLSLGVTYKQIDDADSANVEIRAAGGDFEFGLPPQVPTKTYKFDGSGTHGLCKPVLTTERDAARVEQFRMMKAYLYVPATPTGDRNGSRSPVGDPIKLVIAVHEMVHGCGIIDDKEHSVDDLFCWPQLRMGNKPSEDRLGTLGGTYTFPGKPGEAPRVGHRIVDMPPLILNNPTAEKVRKLWA